MKTDKRTFKMSAVVTVRLSKLVIAKTELKAKERFQNLVGAALDQSNGATDFIRAMGCVDADFQVEADAPTEKELEDKMIDEVFSKLKGPFEEGEADG